MKDQPTTHINQSFITNKLLIFTLSFLINTLTCVCVCVCGPTAPQRESDKDYHQNKTSSSQKITAGWLNIWVTWLSLRAAAGRGPARLSEHTAPRRWCWWSRAPASGLAGCCWRSGAPGLEAEAPRPRRDTRSLAERHPSASPARESRSASSASRSLDCRSSSCYAAEKSLD